MMPYSGMTALTEPMTPMGFAHDDVWMNVRELSDATAKKKKAASRSGWRLFCYSAG